MNDEEIEHHGKDILQKYFTLIVMRQDKSRSYSDSENENFVHQNTNRSLEERKKIVAKYRPLFESEDTTENNNKLPVFKEKKLHFSVFFLCAYKKRPLEFI